MRFRILLVYAILSKGLDATVNTAVDPHSFFADPGLAVLLNADPDLA